MLESNLFGDFARELVRRKESAVWTHAAVLGTWGWNVWMGGRGGCFLFFFPVFCSCVYLLLLESLLYVSKWGDVYGSGWLLSIKTSRRCNANSSQHINTPSPHEP